MDQSNKPSILITSDTKKMQKILIIVGIMALILATTLIVWYLGFTRSKDLANKTAVPSPSSSAKAQIKTPALVINGCDIKKEGNPLIHDLTSLNTGAKKTVVGILRGNINSVTINPAKTSNDLELLSPKADQAYQFSVTNEEGLVYDAIDLKDRTMFDLTKGLTVEISFNCFTQTNKFSLTRINITGKL